MPRLYACAEINQVATALNAGGGTTLVVSLGNPVWAMVASVLATFVTTGTGGNRIIVVQFKDAAGLILWACAQGGNIIASKTTLLALGSGVPAAAPAAPLLVTMPIPDGLILPPLSTITFFDNANIDATDTIAANILLSY